MIKTIKYIACCLAGVLMLLPLQAQNVIRPKIKGPNNLWVNSYNGVLFFELTDYETQNSAMPMQLRFYYNSSSSKVDYGYGLGFSIGYEMRYKEDVIGGVDIETGDGRIDHFVRYGDDYEAPAGVFSTLTKSSDNTYILTTKEGKKYFFDNPSHHKVTSIEDRYGSRTTLKYQDTLLVEVKDAVGHTITLNYTDGLLTQASATFSPGKFKYEYDGLRRLRKRIDPMGNVTLYDYSRQNKLDEIIDANGNQTLISYNSSGMVSRLKTDVSDKSIRYEGDKTIFIDYTEPKNVYSYYRWDEKGRAIEKAGLCCGVQSTYKYDDDDNVIQITDANGNKTLYSYDENGNILSLTDPLGYSEHYSYDSEFNKIVSHRNKNGVSYNLSYDDKGCLISISGPLGFENRYSYDEHGWLLMSSDSKGGITRNNYNPDGTIASILNPDGGMTSYNYDSYGRLSSITDAMGNTTFYDYDQLGRIISQKDALGNTAYATYDKVGNVVRLLDASGHITAYEYNVLGNIISITDVMGNVTSYEYDGLGNIVTEIDPLGIRQEYEYNDQNKLITYTNGAGEKTNIDYDVNGNMIAVMQPNGNITSCEYDELGRLVEISDNLGLIAICEYDGNGNCVSQTDGLDQKVTLTYDALDRLTSEMLPSGSKSQFVYDSNNNLISKTDALGHVTSYEYDAMNRLTSHKDALGAKTLFVYDANGNLTKITDSKGNITTYSYDAMGHNTASTFANGRSLQFSYDKMGHIVSIEDRAGNLIKFNYSPIGNLLSKIYPDGKSDTYTYDANNRMRSAINDDAVIEFTYDGAGRILSESLNGKKTSYSYDVSAGQCQFIYPSGIKITEQFNVRNLITNIFQNGEEVVSINYDVNGQKTCQTYNNGVRTDFNYNENGWLSSVHDNKNFLNYVFTYDALGNIIERKNLNDEQLTERYEYDEINQLTSFYRGNTNSQLYEYDLLGNRIRTIFNGNSTLYSSNNVNAYTSITGSINFTPEYDGNGNLLNSRDHTFTYDYNNKLIKTDQTVIYKYDALDRRIAKNDTYYYYLGNQMIEKNQNGNITSYIYDNNIDEVFLMANNQNKYYFHTVNLGSIIAISDKSADLLESVNYDAYGNPSFVDSEGRIMNESIIGNNILFTGKEFDYESGNYYYRSRYANPTIGRFIQHDFHGYVDGMNDYAFVGNNPINYNDIWGYEININTGMSGGFNFNQGSHGGSGGWSQNAGGHAGRQAAQQGARQAARQAAQNATMNGLEALSNYNKGSLLMQGLGDLWSRRLQMLFPILIPDATIQQFMPPVPCQI